MGCWLVRPTVQHSVQQITDVIDVLNANIQQAEKTQTALRAKARTYARSGNRKHAMHYLKRAKLFDRQIHVLHEARDRLLGQMTLGLNGTRLP